MSILKGEGLYVCKRRVRSLMHAHFHNKGYYHHSEQYHLSTKFFVTNTLIMKQTKTKAHAEQWQCLKQHTTREHPSRLTASVQCLSYYDVPITALTADHVRSRVSTFYSCSVSKSYQRKLLLRSNNPRYRS